VSATDNTRYPEQPDALIRLEDWLANVRCELAIDPEPGTLEARFAQVVDRAYCMLHWHNAPECRKNHPDFAFRAEGHPMTTTERLRRLLEKETARLEKWPNVAGVGFVLVHVTELGALLDVAEAAQNYKESFDHELECSCDERRWQELLAALRALEGGE
jgi:hypothetical protein